MKLFKPSIELVVFRNALDLTEFEIYSGHDVEQLLRQAFGGNGLSKSVRLYHRDLTNDVTPKTPDDVDKVMRLHGRIYAVVKPMGVETLIAIGVSILVSVAIAFLMPVPAMPNASNQPPSPNNALAARTNKQRLGGRIPDIYGQVWSVPDLIAPTYSAYIDNREVEFSYMCVGRGRFNVTEALDDTTPINQVFGSSVYVYDPDDSLNDTPDFLFGSAMTPDEAALSRLAVKRYTSVNGQVLPPADNYLTLDKAVFRAGGIIEQSGVNFVSQFTVGENLTIVQANPAKSANGITEPVDQGDPPAEPPLVGNVVTYSLSGVYVISALTETQVTLSNPATINTDWQKLADNADFTVETEAAVSTKSEAQWQGWFYTASKDHDRALINIRAPQGLYITGKNNFEPIGLDFEIESELVDVTNNPIAGTLERVTRTIYGSKYHKYANNGGNGTFRDGHHWWSGAHVSDDEAAQEAGATFEIPNTHMESGKRLRFRVRRKHRRIDYSGEFQAIQEIRIADFYGARLMTAADAPKGVTTVYTKTLATEGALSLKERKLRLLVQRYVTDATSGLPKLSNRADDILRDIATDPKIGNLQLTQVDIAQIKAEIDAQIAYFGTDKCSEFCGTFDDNNLSAEETMQIVAKAVFGQAKRQGNKIMLDFERKVPASVAVFNSHNILPDTFTAPQSLGIANDYDGVKIEYTDPVDDAVITMSYPNDAIVNPHEDKLIGVRNKVQAHTHMMRMYNKDRHAYKSCEFVAGDESNIVVRTNRITVADQLRADVQQGSVESIETIGGDIVLHTTDPVTIEPSVLHTMFIQTINNGVESIAVTARDDYSVKLARLPSGEISGTDKVVQAVYQIVSETDDNRDAYLVAQKDPSDGMTNKLLCTNYDDRYYQNDKDHIAPIKRNINVLAIGDSTMAAGYGAEVLASYVPEFDSVKSIAVSGHTITQQIAALNDVADFSEITLVIIQVGLNSLGVDNQALIAAYQDLVDTVKANVNSKCLVYLSGMNPCKTRNINRWGQLGQDNWEILNNAISNNDFSADGVFYEHVAMLDDGSGNLKVTYKYDQTHPNLAGRLLIADTWRSKLLADRVITSSPPHVFTPLDLFKGGEQGAWFDVSDLSTLYQDAAGTVPVTADGQPVGLIKDKSGNAKSATQNDSTKKPIFRTNGVTNWLEFDGVDDYLITDINHNAEWSVYAASSAVTSSATTVIYGGRSSTNTRSYIGHLDGQITAGVGATANNLIKSGVTYVSNTPVIGVYAHSSSNVNLRQNGVDGYNSSLSGVVTPPAVGYIGALNNSGSPASYFKGRLYGLIAASNAVISTDAERYLASKSGIAL